MSIQKVTILHTWTEDDMCDWKDSPSYKHKFSIGPMFVTCTSDEAGKLFEIENTNEISYCLYQLKNKLKLNYNLYGKFPKLPTYRPEFSQFECIEIEIEI